MADCNSIRNARDVAASISDGSLPTWPAASVAVCIALQRRVIACCMPMACTASASRRLRSTKSRSAPSSDIDRVIACRVTARLIKANSATTPDPATVSQPNHGCTTNKIPRYSGTQGRSNSAVIAGLAKNPRTTSRSRSGCPPTPDRPSPGRPERIQLRNVAGAIA